MRVFRASSKLARRNNIRLAAVLAKCSELRGNVSSVAQRTAYFGVVSSAFEGFAKCAFDLKRVDILKRFEVEVRISDWEIQIRNDHSLFIA
jgi:hypothetical protein